MGSRRDDLYRGEAAGLYDAVAIGLDGDVAFYVGEAVSANGPVLELGCGTGRILLPIAESGLEATGLDSSPDMLAIARRKRDSAAAPVRERITLVEGDMRSFDLGRQFVSVLIPFRAFQHLLTAEDQLAALACVRRHVAPGGRLVFNLFDPSLEIIVAHAGPLGAALQRHAETTHPESGRPLLVTESRRYDRERQLLHEIRIFEELGEEGEVVSRRTARFTLRYLFRFEVEHLLARAGFRVDALYGDFRRGTFRSGGEQVWVVSTVTDR